MRSSLRSISSRRRKRARVPRQLASLRRAGLLTLPSPPAEPAEACEQQARKTGSDDGAGDTSRDRKMFVHAKDLFVEANDGPLAPLHCWLINMKNDPAATALLRWLTQARRLPIPPPSPRRSPEVDRRPTTIPRAAHQHSKGNLFNTLSLLIFEPLLPPWQRRTNVWRRRTSPARGAKRLRA